MLVILGWAAVFCIGFLSGGAVAAHANLEEARQGLLKFGDEHFACTPVEGERDDSFVNS